jgi:hypothetical protein
MLCLSDDKVMPVAGYCQEFMVNFSLVVLNYKSIGYGIFRSKCFKNKRKKMTLL